MAGEERASGTAAVAQGSTCLHLEAGGRARRWPAGKAFWDDVFAGRLDPDQWLVLVTDIETDMPQWERHPEGEEVLVLMTGAVDIHFDDGARTWSEPLEAGELLVVPPGTWHRFTVREPGRLMFLTWGPGTDHRPL